MRKQPSFNQIQEQKIDINMIKNLMQRLIVELKSDALKYPENKDAIEWFAKKCQIFLCFTYVPKILMIIRFLQSKA